MTFNARVCTVAGETKHKGKADSMWDSAMEYGGAVALIGAFSVVVFATLLGYVGVRFGIPTWRVWRFRVSAQEVEDQEIDEHRYQLLRPLLLSGKITRIEYRCARIFNTDQHRFVLFEGPGLYIRSDRDGVFGIRIDTEDRVSLLEDIFFTTEPFRKGPFRIAVMLGARILTDSSITKLQVSWRREWVSITTQGSANVTLLRRRA